MGRPRKSLLNPNPSVAQKKIALLPEFFDVNTDTDALWEALLKHFSKTARIYGFSRVEMPMFEDLRLYRAFYGRAENEDMNFLLSLPQEAGGAALRPSQLPSVLRSFSGQKLFESGLIHKWHYSGQVAKKSPAGLSVDFEFGCEVLGSVNHLTEAQTISAAWEFLSSLGLEDLVVEINNLGSLESQAVYSKVLVDALLPKKYELCDDCNVRLGVRPLSVFSCENLDCRTALAEAPAILDFLDQDSHKDFTSVLEALDEMNIPYQLNSFYASPLLCERTNFVIKSKSQNKAAVLAEGGHHQSLARAVSGKNFGAFGFSGSMKLLRQLMELDSVDAFQVVSSEVCLVPLGELAAKRSLRLFKDLTAQKITVYDHFGLSGVKNQLKVAQEQKVPIALIMGQKEAIDEMVILRDVKSGMQEIISYDKIVEEVKKRLGK